MIGNRRNITLNTATNRVLVAESGSLINIDNSSDVEITIGLPTIEAGNIEHFMSLMPLIYQQLKK